MFYFCIGERISATVFKCTCNCSGIFNKKFSCKSQAGIELPFFVSAIVLLGDYLTIEWANKDCGFRNITYY